MAENQNITQYIADDYKEKSTVYAYRTSLESIKDITKQNTHVIVNMNPDILTDEVTTNKITVHIPGDGDYELEM